MAGGLALAGVFFSLGSSSKRLRIISVGLVMAIALAIPWSDQLIPAKAAGSKALAVNLESTEGANLVLTHWAPMARIDVLEADESTNPFLKVAVPGDRMKMITADGDANTWMFQHADVRKGVLPPTSETQTSYHTAFLLKDHPEVLIIGPRGGNEIFVAQQMGSLTVTGVELNAEVLDISLRRYADFTGYIYQSPQAQAVEGEGRSYIRRSDRTFSFKCRGWIPGQAYHLVPMS